MDVTIAASCSRHVGWLHPDDPLVGSFVNHNAPLQSGHRPLPALHDSIHLSNTYCKCKSKAAKVHTRVGLDKASSYSDPLKNDFKSLVLGAWLSGVSSAKDACLCKAIKPQSVKDALSSLAPESFWKLARNTTSPSKGFGSDRFNPL